MVQFKINGKQQDVDVDPMTPLLWVIRDHLGMTGTKFGCGLAQCGACTVHLEGQPVRSCSLPVAGVTGKEITTIEGIGEKGGQVLQDAWVEMDVPQCGYCQSGQIMAAHALLKKNPKPTDEEIDTAMNGNVCRCGTYQRIKAAIHLAAERGGVKS